MPHFFKSIRIRNLLSFGPDSPELELKPINIVIGPNGSGKSNLLAAISLLCPFSERADTIEKGGPPQSWFWKGEIKTEAEVIVKLENAKHVIDFSGDITKDGLAYFNHLWYVYDGYPKDKYTRRIADQPDSSVSIEYADSNGNIYEKKTDPYRCPQNLLIDAYIFRDWQFGPSAPVRKPQVADIPSIQMRNDASNLPHILNRIVSNPTAKESFMVFLHELYEGIGDIVIEQFNGYVFFSTLESDLKVPAARISDGTLRYLALLAILCDPEPPNLICLEEPEMGLHPDLIHVVAKAIRYASERTQVIATTHSVSLVDDFTDSPESIVVCEKINGSTELRRLDPAEMAPWLEKYRLGELWTSGEIGGNRW